MDEVLTPSICDHKEIWNVSNDNNVVQEIKKILVHAESHAVSLEESQRKYSPYSKRDGGYMLEHGEI